jgi:outer membrane immunogenic protein
VKAPAYVAPLFTWTGFYLGANLGYGWGDGNGTITNTTLAPVGASGPISGSGDGILGGFQAGYNWQTGPVVFGLETDFQLSGAQGTVTGNAGPRVFRGTGKNEWFGTIRGRVGYAVDRWLFYVTGGGAYSHNKFSGNSTLAGVVTPFSSTATGWGWTVGGGVEAALVGNWSVKGEYLFLDTPDKIPTPAGTRISGNSNSHVIRLGVNYRF